MDTVTCSEINEVNRIFYKHVFKGRRWARWRGHTVMKDPSDLILYQQVIYRKKPDFIVETGTRWGGSAVFFGDMCELMGKGKVISIDIYPRFQPEHKRVTYIKGDSIDREVVKRVKDMVSGSVMVILDSKHTKFHVQWELYHYSKMVTPGQFLVVEDCYNSDMQPSRVKEAKDWFMNRTKRFVAEDVTNQFLLGISRDGWLRRV